MCATFHRKDQRGLASIGRPNRKSGDISRVRFLILGSVRRHGIHEDEIRDAIEYPMWTAQIVARIPGSEPRLYIGRRTDHRAADRSAGRHRQPPIRGVPAMMLRSATFRIHRAPPRLIGQARLRTAAATTGRSPGGRRDRNHRHARPAPQTGSTRTRSPSKNASSGPWPRNPAATVLQTVCGRISRRRRCRPAAKHRRRSPTPRSDESCDAHRLAG